MVTHQRHLRPKHVISIKFRMLLSGHLNTMNCFERLLCQQETPILNYTVGI